MGNNFCKCHAISNIWNVVVLLRGLFEGLGYRLGILFWSLEALIHSLKNNLECIVELTF